MSSSKNRMRKRGHLPDEKMPSGNYVVSFFSSRYFLFFLCALLIIGGIIMTIFDMQDQGYTSYKGKSAYFVRYWWRSFNVDDVFKDKKAEALDNQEEENKNEFK